MKNWKMLEFVRFESLEKHFWRIFKVCMNCFCNLIISASKRFELLHSFIVQSDIDKSFIGVRRIDVRCSVLPIY